MRVYGAELSFDNVDVSQMETDEILRFIIAELDEIFKTEPMLNSRVVEEKKGGRRDNM